MCCGLCTAEVRTKITSSDVFTWISLSSGSLKTPLKSAIDLFFDISFKKKKEKKEAVCALGERI